MELVRGRDDYLGEPLEVEKIVPIGISSVLRDSELFALNAESLLIRVAYCYEITVMLCDPPEVYCAYARNAATDEGDIVLFLR